MPDHNGTLDIAPELPEQLSAVFSALRKGRHISRTDGALFLDLERRTGLYEHVLRALGYTLRSHSQGFYYIEGPETIRSEQMRRVLVFLLVLFQDMEEHKFQRKERTWERSLLRSTFKVPELPHFHTAQRRSLMTAVGLDETAVSKLLQFMDRLGIVRLLPEEEFGFLPPVYRFIDLCIKYADDAQWGTADADSAPPSDPEHETLSDSNDDDEEHDE